MEAMGATPDGSALSHRELQKMFAAWFQAADAGDPVTAGTSALSGARSPSESAMLQLGSDLRRNSTRSQLGSATMGGGIASPGSPRHDVIPTEASHDSAQSACPAGSRTTLSTTRGRLSMQSVGCDCMIRGAARGSDCCSLGGQARGDRLLPVSLQTQTGG